MRSGSHAETPSVFEVVQRAAAVCDPDGEDELIAELLLAYEDRDEPVTAVEEIDRELAEAATAIDPEADEPALAMARAVTVYLAYRRDEADDDRETILRLAARAEFDDHPPPHVADWLAAEGVG